MLFDKLHYDFMFAALTEAERASEQEEIPVGAVVVHNNRIIGKGFNQVEKLKDPTAHAEMIAITAASNYLNEKFLLNCDIYVTLEPCVMCTGAIIHSKIRNLYYSVPDPKSGACGSVYNIPEENKLNHKVNVFQGIYSEESRHLLKNFFYKKR
ncbi:MAG: nucleoside deaminase [Ignavibacteria bacterium]|nr:nucleoside deaminase [Ignavibacteria bacterium]